MLTDNSRNRTGRTCMSIRAVSAAVASAVACMGMATSTHAFQFETSPDWEVRWDNTIRYNAMFRVEKSDSKLDTLDTPLFDDATKSFSRGLVSNRLDLISELDVVWKNLYGFRVSGNAWYDTIYNSDNDHPSTSLSWGSPSAKVGEFTDNARDMHGRDYELADAFVFGNFTFGDIGLGVRAGRHTLYWGQSLLTPGALHGVAGSMAPIDAIKAFTVPGADLQELFMPTTKLSASLQLTPNLTLSSFYSFEFREHRLPAVGSYASPAEHFSQNAEFAALIPVEPLGVVYGVRGVGQEQEDEGEYGVAVEYYFSNLDMDIGVYYLNYSDKLPQGLVAELNLLQFPEALGGLGGFFDGDLLPPNNISVGRMKWTYKDDIDLYGLSFGKEKWGIAFGADLVYRKDAALNTDAAAVFTGRATIPGVLDSGFDDLDESNYGGPVGDTVHLVINGQGFLSTTSLWDGGSYIVEFSASMLDEVTENEQFLNANVEEDDVATHIHARFTPEWYQVFPATDLKIPVTFSYGIDGFAPFVLAGSEELGSASIGLSFLYKQALQLDLTYSASWGPVDNGATSRDRDWIGFTAKYTF